MNIERKVQWKRKEKIFTKKTNFFLSFLVASLIFDITQFWNNTFMKLEEKQCFANCIVNIITLAWLSLTMLVQGKEDI